jgi:MFS transporter, DHA1 family, multidrug resistance protein
MTMQTDVRFLDRASPPHISTLILLAGMAALAMNVFLPSLPAMTTYFETDYQVMQLSVALYLGMNAVMQLMIGPISDRYGRRPVLLWSIAIFTLASLGCVLATTVEVFLAFRMAQAVIVAGIVLSRAVVRDTTTQDLAASKIAYVTMGMALVPMLAPAMGGLLQGTFGWHASFWLMVILGVAMFLLTWADLGETATERSASFAAQFADYPELFRSRRFWGYAMTATFASGAFFAYLGGAPWVGTEIFGLEPTALGVYFGAPAVGYLIGNGLSGRFSVRFGINAMAATGTVICTVGMTISLLIFLLGYGSAFSFFALTISIGLGNGLILPNATAGMLSVRPHLAGTASGIGGAIMIGGGAALSAISGTMLTLETGATVLIAIMLATSVLGVASMIYVIRRARDVGFG